MLDHHFPLNIMVAECGEGYWSLSEEKKILVNLDLMVWDIRPDDQVKLEIFIHQL